MPNHRRWTPTTWPRRAHFPNHEPLTFVLLATISRPLGDYEEDPLLPIFMLCNFSGCPYWQALHGFGWPPCYRPGLSFLARILLRQMRLRYRDACVKLSWFLRKNAYVQPPRLPCSRRRPQKRHPERQNEDI